MGLKFFTDTHIAKAVAVQLRERGVDIVRCEEVGMATAKDPDLLAYAAEQERAIVSHDDDFLRLHDEWQEQGREHAGIMYVLPHLQGTKNVGRVIKVLLEFHQMIELGAGTVEEDIHNQRHFIS